MWSDLRHGAAAAACAAAACALLVLAHHRRRRRLHGGGDGGQRSFAPMATELGPSTVAALTRHRWLQLRHKVEPRGIDPAMLEASFEAIRANFAPQQVDYSNTAYGKNHWTLSCFMEYTNGVAARDINLAAGGPMLEVCRHILDACDAVFLPWYETLHPTPRGGTRELIRMQSFVTRYRPNPEETHLPRHIDGANVDGSLVLGLPTYDSFGATGGLTVWDGEADAEEFVYPVASGDVALLDSRVWHQSNPIRCGERWVIVIFYEVQTTKPAGAEASSAPRAKVVRDLLAKRIKDAAKRREASVTAETVASKPEAAWHR